MGVGDLVMDPNITLLTAGDEETSSLTDHKTCSMDFDMNSTLNDVK